MTCNGDVSKDKYLCTIPIKILRMHILTLFEDVQVSNIMLSLLSYTGYTVTCGFYHCIKLPQKSLFPGNAKSRYEPTNKLLICIKVDNNKNHPNITCKKCTQSRTRK